MDAHGWINYLTIDPSSYLDLLSTGLLVGAVAGLIVIYFLRRSDVPTRDSSLKV